MPGTRILPVVDGPWALPSLVDLSRGAAAAALLIGLACSGGEIRGEGRGDAGDASVPAAAVVEAAEEWESGRPEGTGVLEVVLSWAAPPAEALRSPGPSACGAPVRAPVQVFLRSRTDAVTALVGAVITLPDVVAAPPGDAGEAAPPSVAAPDPAELAIRDCSLTPPVTGLARPGEPLWVVSQDERQHTVLLEHLGDLGVDPPELLATIPLALAGRRYVVRTSRAGIVRARHLSEERDHAYLVVPANRFTAVTDEQGVARFEDVPAGEQEIRAWHPPLAPGGEPLRAGGKVEIRPDQVTKFVLRLAF